MKLIGMISELICIQEKPISLPKKVAIELWKLDRFNIITILKRKL